MLQSLPPICSGPSVSKVECRWEALGKVTGPYSYSDCLEREQKIKKNLVNNVVGVKG